MHACLAVQEAISLIGGIESFVRPHDKVIIKPNLVLALPSDTGLTTDPRVVQAIVELCRRVNPSDVTIASFQACMHIKKDEEGTAAASSFFGYAVCIRFDVYGRIESFI